MSDSVRSAKDFCIWLEHLSQNENYKEILRAFENPGTFRALWANVGEAKNLFRCRKHREEEKDTLFGHSSDIGYRRDEAAIENFGRCNGPKQAVAYFSESPITSLLETFQNTNEGEIFVLTMGRWEMRKTVDTLYVVQPIKEKRIHKYEHLLGDRYDAHVAEMIKAYPDYEEFSSIYFDYLDSKFKSAERGLQYQVTAAYSSKCYEVGKNGGAKSYGIIYASVTDTDFFNVAFTKEVEDSQLISLKGVVKSTIKIKKTNPKKQEDFELVAETIAKNVTDEGVIQW